jgi:hypothetical protein
VDLLLYKAPGTKSAAANALHEYLAHYLGIEQEVGQPREISSVSS